MNWATAYNTQQQKQLVLLCQDYQVVSLELFGSAARAQATASSDLDFLVSFVPARKGLVKRFFGFKQALEELFDCSVDLLEVGSIRNPYLQEAIDKEKISLYVA